MGKLFSSHQWTLVTNGDWLLSTDADTVHTKSGIARAVCYAERTNLDGSRDFLEHQVSGWINSLALDTAYAGLFAGWNATNHMLNGQFILIRRRTYFDSGGFESFVMKHLKMLLLEASWKGWLSAADDERW
jgi:hypothetical protein